MHSLKYYLCLMLLIPMGAAFACEQQYVYSSHLVSSPTLSSVKQFTSYSAVVTIKSVRKGKEEGWWAIKSDQPLLKIDGQERNATAYAAPFAFRLDKQGMISRFWFYGYTSLDVQQSLKGMAYHFQYKKSLAKQYVSDEQEYENVYRYQYRQDGELIKTKQQKLFPSSGLISEVNILHSEIKLQPGNCLLEGASGHEQLAIKSDVSQFNAMIESRFSLNKATNKQATLLMQLPDDIALWPTIKRHELTENERVRLNQKMLTWAKSIDPSKDDVFLVAEQLAEFGQVNEGLLELVSQEAISDEVSMRLINAIGLLDSPDSHSLLLSMLNSSELSDNNRFRALMALASGHNDLTAESTLVIAQLIEDGIETEDLILANSLLPSLGIVLGNRPDSENARQLTNQLAESLMAVQAPEKQGQLITALGNSKTEEHTELIVEFSQSQDPTLRYSSAYALGKVQGEQAYHALGEMLLFEPDSSPKVKVEIIKSLSHFTLEQKELNLVSGVARNGESSTLRLSAVTTINAQPKETRTEILKGLLKTESNTETFQQIINGIHSP